MSRPRWTASLAVAALLLAAGPARADGPPAAPSPSSTASGGERRVLLLLDASGSMAGDRLRETQQAAAAFVDAAPAGVLVGVASFNDAVTVLAPPTADRAAARAALARVTARGSTRLYDAVTTGVGALGGSGDRRIVLLSDGADTASAASLADAVAAVTSSGTAVSAVGLAADTATADQLAALAGAGHGRVVQVPDAAGLARALQVTAVAPPAPAAPASAPTTSSPPGRTTSADAAPPAPRGAPPALLAGGLAAVAAGLGVAGALLVSGRSGGRAARRRLLAAYTLDRRAAPEPAPAGGALGRSRVARTAVGLAARVASRRDTEARLALALDRAGVPLRPAEWLLVQAGTAAAVLLLAVLAGHLLLGVLLAALAGALGPRALLRARARRRQARFAAQMPDALQLVAGSLSAGYSLAQALDAVVAEGTEPFAGEIGRALAESRLGVPLEDALDGVAERIGLEDFRWVVIAIATQRSVGGNLAEVLRGVVTTMRERARLHRHVRALAAEGRLSAYVLVGLPVAMALFELAFRRSYIRPLYTTAPGLAMSAGGVVLVLLGSLWMAKLVKVEV